MDPQLYRAAKLGDVTLLRQVVNEDSTRLLRVTPQENTLLHVSVRFGHKSFVKEVYAALLQHNSSLEGDTAYSRSLSLLTQMNSVGDTALHVAARAGHASIAKFLIQKILPWLSSGHDIENGNSSPVGNRVRELAREKIRMRNKSKDTAMHQAVRRNDHEMVKLLTETDPELGHSNYDADEEGGESPLYVAARDGCLGIINQIFLICLSPAHGGPHGRTALHVAVVEEKLDVVKILLGKKGELVNKVDENGRTPLHYAVSKRCLKIVKQLLRHDTSCAYQLDKDGLSPLHIAALQSTINVFQELIQRCPDSGELLDKKRRSVIHFAVMSEDFKKIRFALQQVEFEEHLNQPDDDGNTPFHLAASQGSLELMKLFLSNGIIDVKAINNKGQTATEIFVLLSPQGTLYSATIFSMSGWFHLKALDLRQCFAIRGEEKWIIGEAANEEKIRNDPDKKDEALAAEAIRREEKTGQTLQKMGQTLQIVASLIASVTFAAIFQVPGGYNNKDGTPILLNNICFRNFIEHDTKAMVLSIASLVFMLGGQSRGNSLYSLLLIVATYLIFLALFQAISAFENLLCLSFEPSAATMLATFLSPYAQFSNLAFTILFFLDVLRVLFLSFRKKFRRYFSVVNQKKKNS